MVNSRVGGTAEEQVGAPVDRRVQLRSQGSQGTGIAVTVKEGVKGQALQ